MSTVNSYLESIGVHNFTFTPLENWRNVSSSVTQTLYSAEFEREDCFNTDLEAYVCVLRYTENSLTLLQARKILELCANPVLVVCCKEKEDTEQDEPDSRSLQQVVISLNELYTRLSEWKTECIKIKQTQAKETVDAQKNLVNEIISKIIANMTKNRSCEALNYELETKCKLYTNGLTNISELFLTIKNNSKNIPYNITASVMPVSQRMRLIKAENMDYKDVEHPKARKSVRVDDVDSAEVSIGALLAQPLELRLSSMGDPFTSFLRMVAGSTGYSLVSMFSNPDVLPPIDFTMMSYSVYLQALITDVYAAFQQTNVEVLRFSKEEQSLYGIISNADNFAVREKALVPCAMLCGQHLRSNSGCNPKKTSMTRATISSMLRDLTNARIAVAKVLQQVKNNHK